MKLSFRTGLLVCLCTALHCASASNLLITGVLTSAYVELSGQFQPGQQFSLSYSFDALANDVNPDPNVGDFTGALSSGVLKIGSYEATATGGRIVVNDGTYGSGTDRLSLGSFYWNSTVAGPAIGAYFPYGFDFELNDSTGKALKNDSLANIQTDVSKWDSRIFRLSFAQRVDPIQAYGSQQVFGTVQAVQLVPEPSSVSMMLAGLAAIAMFVFRRQQQKRAGLPGDHSPAALGEA